MAKILISGGTGLLGNAICDLLLEMKHEPVVLSRGKTGTSKFPTYAWNPAVNYIDPSALIGIDYVIHLAGSGIIDHAWTGRYKKQLIESRVTSSQFLFESLTKNNVRIKKFVGASAVGFYGSEVTDHLFSEEDAAGRGFLAEVCVHWESSYEAFVKANIPTAVVRLGIVLDRHAGAFGKIRAASKLRLLTTAGSGKQYFPWIHLSDAAALFVKLLFEHELTGTFNAVAGEHITHQEMITWVANKYDRKIVMPPIPEWFLTLVLGERAITITRGLKISNEKIRTANFRFKYNRFEECVDDLIS